MSALVPLEVNSIAPEKGFYQTGKAMFHTVMWVCVKCETVIASVKDNPVCPTCELREEFEEYKWEKEST